MPTGSGRAPVCRQEIAVGLGGGRREGAACSCHHGRHRRTEVVACGSSGLATDEGADSGAVRAWGGWAEGRRAKGLGLAGSGGFGWGEDAAADGENATVSLLFAEGGGGRGLAGCLHMRTRARTRWEGSCHLVPTNPYSSMTLRRPRGTHSLADPGADGHEKDGQSSAPRHWALGTVQLRREELDDTGRWAGEESQESSSVPAGAGGTRKYGGFQGRCGCGVQHTRARPLSHAHTHTNR